MYTIHRYQEGISLNPREYIVDKNDIVVRFKTKDEAVNFLIPHFDLVEIFADQGVHIEEVQHGKGWKP